MSENSMENGNKKIITETAIGIDPYSNGSVGEISRFGLKNLETGETIYGNLEWEDGVVDSEVVFREIEARLNSL